MNQQIINEFVKQKLATEPTGHDYLHIIRVVQNAKKIMDDNIDQDVVIASCFVHDLIDHKLDEEFKSSLEEIKNLLHRASLTDIQIQKVIDIIENISFSGGSKPKSIEGLLVQDADRLDALGAIGIARTFSYGGKNNRLIYDPDSINGEDSRSHFYQKLLLLKDLMNTEKARKEAEIRTTYMIEFLKQLDLEIMGK